MKRRKDTLPFELDGETAQGRILERAPSLAFPLMGEASDKRRLEIFEELQRSLQLTPDKAEAWKQAVQEARR